VAERDGGNGCAVTHGGVLLVLHGPKLGPGPDLRIAGLRPGFGAC
jgi:hypothetical protein